MSLNFIDQYLEYTNGTETPLFFNRWSCIVGLGALLGRNYYFNHGHFTINPNIYCMLIGSPGTRKSTAIKTIKNIIVTSGYETIAADKTTKEKFLLDLSGELGDEKLDGDKFLEANLWGESNGIDREMFICADEFNDFFGNGNIEFISLLGTLWDYKGVYKSRIKHGKSVAINNPTISILGGNTPVGFSLAFPAEILGQGFFSRILLIHGEPNGRKIAFPKIPDIGEFNELIKSIQLIRTTCIGELTISLAGEKLLTKIYINWKGVDDVRFESYSNRRFTHLLKLCIICSASNIIKDTSGKCKITEEDIILANTILTHTEYLMPRALGEFGKARNSDVVHKVMQILEGSDKVMTVADILPYVNNDLDNGAIELSKILVNLQQAGRVQHVDRGYLPRRKVKEMLSDDTINYDLLTIEEREIGI